MTTFKFILLVLTILQKAITFAEKQGIIRDEQRRELLRQLQLATDAVQLRKKIDEQVGKMDDKAVDDALADDFRRP